MHSGRETLFPLSLAPRRKVAFRTGARTFPATQAHYALLRAPLTQRALRHPRRSLSPLAFAGSSPPLLTRLPASAARHAHGRTRPDAQVRRAARPSRSRTPTASVPSLAVLVVCAAWRRIVPPRPWRLARSSSLLSCLLVVRQSWSCYDARRRACSFCFLPSRNSRLPQPRTQPRRL